MTRPVADVNRAAYVFSSGAHAAITHARRSAALILTWVPRHRLITSGPFAVVKHPLYTGVAFLVLPWAGFLADTWLGALLAGVLYLASRRFAPEEERALSATFGPAWDDYRGRVVVPWL